MSHSYKKTPRCGDCKTSGKKFANRKYRRLMNRDICNNYHHGEYKKNYCKWDICDYESIFYSFDEYWKREVNFYNYLVCTGRNWNWDRKNQCKVPIDPPNKAESYKEWYKCYKRK